MVAGLSDERPRAPKLFRTKPQADLGIVSLVQSS